MHQRPQDCKDGTLERSLYPVNRGFSQLACCMAFNVYEVIRVACLSHSWFIYYLFLGGHICALKGTPTWCLHTKPHSVYIWVKCFPNISQMKYHTDLILGEAFCIHLLLFAICCAFCIKWFALLLLMAWQWKQRIIFSIS